TVSARRRHRRRLSTCVRSRVVFFFQAEDGIRDFHVTGVQTCALPISLDLGDYRRQIGAVPQSPFLFSGTVADNIRYPRPDATDDEVRAAAAAVGGGDWVDALPHGLDTDVGEHGRALSMGQRQLVALARLLIQDPAIVVLDEATASVDPLTEAQIQEG